MNDVIVYQRFGDLKNIVYFSDDSAYISGLIKTEGDKINFTIALSRIYSIKREELVIAGQEGVITLQNGVAREYTTTGKLYNSCDSKGESVMDSMFGHINKMVKIILWKKIERRSKRMY